MGENVTYFGELADKFDALVAYDETLLDGWVEEHGYSLGSMVSASGLTALMHFSKGFTDVGRLGNGLLIEGGAKGAAKDVLRALNLVGSAGAMVGRAAKLLRTTQVGNTCVLQSTTNALRLTGNRFLLTVKDLARQTGMNLTDIIKNGRGADDYLKLLNWMQSMGIQARVLAQGSAMSVEKVLELVRANPGGVVTFSVRFGQAGGLGHRLYATWSRLGGLVVRDPNYVMRTYRSVADVQRAFGIGVSVSSTEVHFIPNALLIEGAELAADSGGLAGLLLQVVPLLKVPAKDPETALQALMVREATDGMGPDAGGAPKPAPAPAPRPSAAGSGAARPAAAAAGGQSDAGSSAGQVHGAGDGETLNAIANRYYGTADKWPVLWYANYRLIGGSPSRLRSGQKLLVPKLPQVMLSPPGQIEQRRRLHLA